MKPLHRLLPAIGIALCALPVSMTVAAPVTPPVIRLSEAQIRTAGIRFEVARPAKPVDADSPVEAGGLRLTGQVGTVGEHTTVVLSAVAGQVESVYAQLGTSVRPGQPVVRLYSAELPSMQREYLHARAAAELADDKLARDEALFKEGIIAESRLRETRAARQMALATRGEQRRVLLLAGYSDREIGSLTPESISASVVLHAREAGVLLEQPATVGQHVEPGAVLLRMAPASTWWLELQASKQQAAQIHVGDRVRVAGCKGSGRVIAIGTQLLSNTQTVPVRAEIPNAAACLRPNQYLEADLLPGSLPKTLVAIPASALVRSGDSEYVFAKRGASIRPARVVSTGRQAGDVLVREGIDVGTVVASSGVATLKGVWAGLGSLPDDASPQ